ncbi:MAG: T9SS type A sorting domain-containing protein [Flavobacteriales bacterium]
MRRLAHRHAVSLFSVEDPDRGVFTDYNVNFYPVLLPRSARTASWSRSSPLTARPRLYRAVPGLPGGHLHRGGAGPGRHLDRSGSRSLVIERHQLVQGVEVFDLQGRVVQRTPGPLARTTALGDMPSGVYLFRMWSEGGVVVRRMMVE